MNNRNVVGVFVQKKKKKKKKKAELWSYSIVRNVLVESFTNGRRSLDVWKCITIQIWMSLRTC
jgi:hypothetical protein